MTQQAIDGQPSGAQDATDPTAASGQSTDQGAQQQAVTPATSDGGTVRTVPLATYTQASQRSAAIARELGISKDASPAEFVAALSALRTTRQVPDDDDDEGLTDPRLLERMRQQDEREWQGARRDFGDPVVDAAQAFADTLKTTRSPYEMAAALATALTDLMAAGANPAPEAGGDAAEGEAVPEVPDLGTLPRGGSSGEIDPREHRGDTVGFLSRLYAKAGIPQRGQSR